MLALLLCAVALLGEGPFAELGYEAALAQAEKEQKLLIVDFTASWCPPCKKMEKDTWPDARVQAWLKENAIAIQVDVDENPKLARQYSIESIPAVVALRGGKEFDRSVGYVDPARFLSWAANVKAGKSAAAGLLERSKALRESDDVDARYDLAKDLVAAREYDEALAHYLWIWPASRAVPALAGMRLTSLLGDMAGLARRHPPADEAFRKILEELQAGVDQPGMPSYLAWSEWCAFCESLGERARIVAWYETRRDADGRLFADSTDATGRVISSKVFEALLRSKRPADAVRLYPDARAKADEILAQYAVMTASLARQEAELAGVGSDPRKTTDRKLIGDLTDFYGPLLAAGRTEEATYVAEKLLSTLDVPDARVELVRSGLAATQKPRPEFATWLDQAEQGGANVKSLRRKLERAQKNAAGG